MYNKTTSSQFLQHGHVSNNFRNRPDYITQPLTLSTKFQNELTFYNEPVYIEPTKGMSTLLIYNQKRDELELYCIHRNILVHKKLPFTLFPMTGTSCVNLHYKKGDQPHRYPLNTPYVYPQLKPEMAIDEILAFYYVVKSPNYRFPGEIHDSYELTYVDSGSLSTHIDHEAYELNTYDLCFYAPGQFHTQEITSDKSCSYLSIIFDVNQPLPKQLLNRVFKSNKEVVYLLQQFTKQADKPHSYHATYLSTLLMLVIMNLIESSKEEHQIKPTSPNNQYYEDTLLEEILTYINTHLHDSLPIDQICNEFSLSRSSLQNLFKENLSIAPKQYINEAKLNRSRNLIRDGQHTISEIAYLLGFTSIHYFSRKFTHRFGITPSEYARKIYDQDE